MRPRIYSTIAAVLSAFAFALLMATVSDTPNGGALCVTAAGAQESLPPLPAPMDDAAAPAGADVLAQGPVHEAFASPLQLNPQPGPTVKKRPPNPIEELPPEQQPEGDNIVWIPGYFAWDDDRQDFIWVSGVYRNAPPGQTWVPGAWSEVAGGYQWTAGFWTATTNQEVKYLPAPPQTLEAGPNIQQPGDNYFWMPGSWVYQDRYVWRPGYWTVCRPDWIWTPAHYMWTPCGFVFVNGYWDYSIVRRGCLFAPVYFNQPLYAGAAFVWTPRVLINVGLFTDHLFIRPTYCHYYFGDYYAAQYANFGFHPWFSVGIGGGVRYDPLFTYYRWNNSRVDRNWLSHTQQHFDQLRRNEAARPPHTFVAQEQLLKRGVGRPGDKAVVTTIAQVAKDPAETGFKFRNVNQQDRQALASKGKEIQQIAQQRVEIEKKNSTDVASGGSGGKFGAVAGGNTTGAAVAKSWKLPTVASSKVTLAAENQGGDATAKTGTGNLGANAGAGASRIGRSATGLAPGNNLAGGQSQAGGGSGSATNSNNSPTQSKRNLGNAAGTSGLGNSTQSGGSGAGTGAAKLDGGIKIQDQTSNQNQNNAQRGGRSNSLGSSTAGGNPLGNPAAGTTGNLGSPSNSGGRTTYQSGGGPQQSLSGNATGGGLSSGIRLPAGAGTQSGGASGGNNLRSFGGLQSSGGLQQGGGGGNVSGGQPRFSVPNNPLNSGSGAASSGGSGNNGSGRGGGNSGSNSSSGKDKDKDDPKKKSSDVGPPRSDMNLGTGRPSIVDVRDVMKTDRRSTSNSTMTPNDALARELKSAGKPNLGIDDELDRLTKGSPSSSTIPRPTVARDSDTPSAESSPLFRLPSERFSGGRSALLGSNNQGSSSMLGGDAKQSMGNGKLASDRGAGQSDQGAGKSGGGTNGPASGGSGLLSGAPSKSSTPSRNDYQSLLERGRTLSQQGAGGLGGSPTETPDVNTLRRVKDPVTSGGLGGTAGRTAYGPDGSPDPTGGSSSAGIDSSRPTGLGSYVSPNTMPKLQKFDTRLDRRTVPGSSSDPSLRTYDPVRGY